MMLWTFVLMAVNAFVKLVFKLLSQLLKPVLMLLTRFVINVLMLLPHDFTVSTILPMTLATIGTIHSKNLPSSSPRLVSTPTIKSPIAGSDSTKATITAPTMVRTASSIIMTLSGSVSAFASSAMIWTMAGISTGNIIARLFAISVTS